MVNLTNFPLIPKGCSVGLALRKGRRAMLLFFDALYSTGCTCIVSSELRTPMLERRFQLEEFLSQGAILLRTHIHEGNVAHAIQVEKMCGIAHDTQLRPYQIGAKMRGDSACIRTSGFILWDR